MAIWNLFQFACGKDWPGWQNFKVFDGNMERILVWHAEKIGLAGKLLKIFLWQYGTYRYLSFACGEDWPGWQKFKVFYGNMERILVLHAEKIGLDGKNL
jgi:hypothetical protein